MWLFCDYYFLLVSFIVRKARYKWPGGSAVEVNIYCCVFTLSLNYEILTLIFCRLRQRNVLKCVPHEQHDSFSSFNQSDSRSCASRSANPWTCVHLHVQTPTCATCATCTHSITFLSRPPENDTLIKLSRTKLTCSTVRFYILSLPFQLQRRFYQVSCGYLQNLPNVDKMK